MSVRGYEQLGPSADCLGAGALLEISSLGIVFAFCLGKKMFKTFKKCLILFSETTRVGNSPEVMNRKKKENEGKLNR